MAAGGATETVKQYEASFLSPEGSRAARVERQDPPPSQKYFSWVSLADARGAPARSFNTATACA